MTSALIVSDFPLVRKSSFSRGSCSFLLSARDSPWDTRVVLLHENSPVVTSFDSFGTLLGTVRISGRITRSSDVHHCDAMRESLTASLHREDNPPFLDCRETPSPNRWPS
jgi:hypothetical protein